jgi:hypothetical protein
MKPNSPTDFIYGSEILLAEWKLCLIYTNICSVYTNVILFFLIRFIPWGVAEASSEMPPRRPCFTKIT